MDSRSETVSYLFTTLLFFPFSFSGFATAVEKIDNAFFKINKKVLHQGQVSSETERKFCTVVEIRLFRCKWLVEMTTSYRV